MPITIKELFPSDPLSEALEKINFNFDQLILAGGGPPGPAGPIGPQGVPGPLGIRGDHWFVGASALGQTADHDGGTLKVQDHFLDSLGNVYSYFDNGSTGWTATGINLKGPTGPTGVTGGSDDVLIRAGGSGNAVTPTGNGYGPQASTTPTALVDFWIPKNMAKNSIFVGDADWATNFLENFGSNSSAVTDQNSVPQFSVIQKNTNQSALNGLMIGAMGGGYGSTSGGGIEGGTGATTSVFDFVHFAFGKPFVGGSYDRMFRIKSFRQKFRIEVGGNGTYEALSNLQLASKEFSWINNTDGQYISGQTKQGIISYSLQNYTGLTGSGIEIFSKPDWGNSYVNQKSGIVGFQNVQGVAPSSPLVNFNTLHGFGNVHIGATSVVGGPIGTRSQQGLGIARPIGFGPGLGNNDAAIRFFATDFLEAGNEISSVIGGIRPYTQSITNTSGTFSIRAIQFGAGYGITTALSPSTQSRQVGGRIGINNHPGLNDFDQARSINFPIHFNLGGFQGNDKATSAYPGQAPLSIIEQWALGLDYDKITGGETGSYHAGWDTDSPGFGIAYGYGYTAATGGTTWTTRPLVLSSYYAGGATYNAMSGRRNPNLYMQVARDGAVGNTGDGGFGNLGIGFTPNWSTPGKWMDAWSKLSINGGITIGGVENGWHEQNDLRPFMGISVQGAIYQGATGINGLFATAYFGATGVNNLIGSNIKIASNGAVMGDKFIAKGIINESNLNNIPHISLPDLRTGISQFANQQGRGYFTTPSTTVAGGTYGSGPTAGSTSVAYWSINAQDGFNSIPAPAFVIEKRAVEATNPAANSTIDGKTYTLQNLVDRGYATFFSYNNGSQTNIVRKSWLVVPSDTSTVVLDLTQGASFGMWSDSNTWIGPYTGTGTEYRYLEGSSDVFLYPMAPPSGNVYNSKPGQWGITIEPGRYDGQKLTVIIKNVNSRNSFNGTYEGLVTTNSHLSELFTRFKTENPVSSVSFPLSAPFAPASPTPLSNSVIADSLVMARDFLAPESIGLNTNKEWPYGFGLDSNGYNIGLFNLPYGSPNGSLSSSAVTLASNGLGTATMYASVLNAGKSGLSQAGWYTDIEPTNVNLGTGGTLILASGWKVIHFTWLRNYIYSGGNQSTGCWVETGREVIAPRGHKNYGPPIV